MIGLMLQAHEPGFGTQTAQSADDGRSLAKADAASRDPARRADIGGCHRHVTPISRRLGRLRRRQHASDLAEPGRGPQWTAAMATACRRVVGETALDEHRISPIAKHNGGLTRSADGSRGGCLHPAEADVRPPKRCSGFDPQRTLRPLSAECAAAGR
jgi:hypothetical protein